MVLGLKAFFIIVACILVVTACKGVQNQVDLGHNTTPPYTELQKLHSFVENYVKVDIVVEKDAVGNMILASTYTPTKAGFHLYSKDLPKDGIDGAGRPTLLEIIQMKNMRATGQLFADQPIKNHYVEGFSEPFPIYPDGPVTLRLPIQTENSVGGSIQVQIAVTYMACSSQGRCLPPIVEKQVRVEIADNVVLTE